jgi:oxalate decarboxylase
MPGPQRKSENKKDHITEERNQMITERTQLNHEEGSPFSRPLSRRNILGVGSGIAATFFAAGVAEAQQRAKTQRGEGDHSESDPGPENRVLLAENPSSNKPPATDQGDVGPIWYSFDLAHKRIQEGGWTHQVTQRELPSSKDLAGVNMRLTVGSFRELHWHTADEWAIMLSGNARVSVLKPDGTVFLDDVSKGDLWYFPAGYPHSIQGLGPDGCEFLLVFNEGMFSEDDTFLLSEWLAHTPPEVLSKNFGLDRSALTKLPTDPLYIFPADLPNSLAEDRAAVGGRNAQSPSQYTFHMHSMTPTVHTSSGDARIVDSHNFPVAKNIAAAMLTIKPGGMRELHWHPNASEWQYYISGKGRMTVFMPVGEARTMDFKANDVGYVPAMAGHYVENTGDSDLVVLEMFRAPEFVDVSLNNWLRHLPPEMVTSHLGLNHAQIARIPAAKMEFVGGS